jgi:hypothetical protein
MNEIYNQLVETLAEKVHEAWQEEKHKQGIYNHPDDIPYSELKDNIKEYDRVTVRTVLNALSFIFSNNK